MTRSIFLTRIGFAAIFGAVAAAALWLGAGPRLYEFYGWAVGLLVFLALAARPLIARLAVLGYPRWPALVLIGIGALSALTQIGFWAAFFTLGERGILLGLVRTMALEAAGPLLPYAAAAWALALGWLVARAAGPEFRPR